MKELEARKIILASQSPRRSELLTRMGLTFEIQPAQGEEKLTSSVPWRIVEELSAQKAEEIYKRNSARAEAEPLLVIGADTVVAVQGRILGKPKNEKEAKAMLHLLQGKTHQVYTGVTLIWNEQDENADASIQKQDTFHEETEVLFYPMTEQEIEEYVSTGDCMDKAGAYGIQTQSGVYIQGIHGDYNNVVGLPAARLYQELKKLFGR